MKKKRDTTRRPATAARLDALHDAGADLSAHLDVARAARPGRVTQRVNVDFPEELLQAIDREARRIGVTRQAFIKMRLADTVDR
jgi:predicted DNA binding CopG/RHH family protein